jgi:hypothetical protein
MDHCCRKDDRISEFSGVISATRALPIPAEVLHGHFHHTATPTQGRADSQPLTNRPHDHRNPYKRSSAHEGLRGRVRHAPPPFRSRIRPQPDLRTYLPSPPAPAPSQFPQYMPVQPCAASELYSWAIQQRRRPTPAPNVRYWPTSCGNNHHRLSCPQFGRRGRGFKSRHPDQKPQVRRLAPQLIDQLCGPYS